jgi:hypothetical protein
MDFSASKELWRFFSQYEHPTANITEYASVNFKIWPNPASDYISIQIPNKKITQLSIIDIQGRIVSQTNGSDITTTNIENLATGNYIIEVLGHDFIARQKLAINR